MLGEYKYLAFISYKREDEKWAKWLQYKLEHYNLPSSVRKINPSLPERVCPVFKDTTDLAGGVLEKAIKDALDTSKYLIVICSPLAAQSLWVCREVQEFIDSGREEFIIPFIVDGNPNAKNSINECFPKNLRKLSGCRELLGININEMGRDAAAIKIVARMFNLQFDILWQRNEREQKIRRKLIVAFSLLGVVVAFSIVYFMFIQHRKMQINQARAVAHRAEKLIEEGQSYLACKLLVEVLPNKNVLIPRPYVIEAEKTLRKAMYMNSARLKGHTGNITSIDFNPDGNSIISASTDRTLKLWDIESGKCIRTFEGHTDVVIAATFSVDGEKVISVSEDCSIKTWDINTGLCISSVTWHYGRKMSDYDYDIIFSPNRDFILVNGTDGSIIWSWNVNNGELIQEFRKHTYPIKSFALSSDGQRLITRDAVTVNIWDIDTGRCLDTFEGQTDIIYNEIIASYGIMYLPSSTCISNDGYQVSRCYSSESSDWSSISLQQLCSNDIILSDNCKDSTIVLALGGKNITHDRNSTYRQAVVSFYDNLLVSDGIRNVVSHSGKYIASLQNNSSINIFNTKTGKHIQLALKDYYESDVIYSMTFSMDDNNLILISREHIKIWDVHLGECTYSKSNLLYGYPMSYSPDKKFVALRYIDNTINVVDIYSGLLVHKFELSSHATIMDVKFTHNGNSIVVVYPRKMELLDIHTGECIIQLGNDSCLFNQACIHPNGKYILAVSNYSAQLWDIQCGECMQIFDDNIISTSFTIDGKQVVLVTKSGLIKLSPFKSLQELIYDVKHRFKDIPLTEAERKDNYLL